MGRLPGDGGRAPGYPALDSDQGGAIALNTGPKGMAGGFLPSSSAIWLLSLRYDQLALLQINRSPLIGLSDRWIIILATSLTSTNPVAPVA